MSSISVIKKVVIKNTKKLVIKPVIKPVKTSILKIEESIYWMIQPDQVRYLQDYHIQQLQEKMNELNQIHFQMNDDYIMSLIMVINKIMLWCDCSGNFTRTHLMGEHAFIQCIQSLYEDVVKIKKSILKQ